MNEWISAAAQLAWPLALVVSWMAGELAHRWTGVPRISVYGLAGFLAGNLALKVQGAIDHSPYLLLASLAFGLILFELGYRINLRWLRANPWILATSLLESGATFVGVWLAAHWFGAPPISCGLLGALAMATSPAGLLRVLNEEGAGGQVSERAMHLAALNCVAAVFVFNLIVGVKVFQTSGDLLHAAGSTLLVLAASGILGGLAGALVPLWLKFMGGRNATLTFALAVLLVVAATHVFKLSPVFAALCFGLAARHRRSALGVAQRNFGALGDLLSVLLFVFAASTLTWDNVRDGLLLGALLVLVRMLVKVGVCAALSRPSGISVRKGALSGLALAPLAVFAVLMIEQTRRLGVEFNYSLAPLTAIALLLQVVGPLITQRALVWADETHQHKEA
jgi:Kef-type K+ transport system membrane component KefB